MSSISSGTTSTTGYVVSSDTTGALVLKTGSAATTAVTIDTSQNVGINGTSSGGRLVISQNNATQPAIYLPTDESTIQGPVSNTKINMGSNLYLYSAGVLGLATANTERARFDSSGNLLIGTTIQSPNTTAQIMVQTGAATKPAFQYGSGDGNWFGRISSGASGGTIANFSSISGSWSVSGTTFSCTKDFNGSFPSAALCITNQYNNDNFASFRFLKKAAGSTTTDGAVTEMMVLNDAGNLGLGVTPSAWASSSKAIQLGTIGLIENDTNSSFYFGRNGYRSSGAWIYSTTSSAQLFGLSGSGSFEWYTAPSGTAGGNISFTQAMTLNASGNLVVGTTAGNARFTAYLDNSAAYANTAPSITNCTAAFVNGSNHTSGGTFVGYQLNISGNSQNRIGYIGAVTESASNQALSLVFGTNTAGGDRTEKMRLDSDGNLTLNGAGYTTPAYFAGNFNLAQVSINRSPTTGAIANASQSAAFMNIDGVSGGSSFQFCTASANNTQPSEKMRLDSTNGLQVGTSTGNSGANGLHVTGTILQGTSGLYQAQISISGGNTIQASTLGVGYEPLRLNPLGSSVYINCTSIPTGTNGGTGFVPAGAYGVTRLLFSSNNTATVAVQAFDNPNGNVGSLGMSGSSTYYSTSSDYRLKENITPMTGALAKVALMKPVNYKWKADGSDGEGFIAHELAEVCPHAVIGEKDAVDDEGKIKSQSIDTSFLVATLTAAIQEQQLLIQQLQADVAILKGGQQ